MQSFKKLDNKMVIIQRYALPSIPECMTTTVAIVTGNTALGFGEYIE